MESKGSAFDIWARTGGKKNIYIYIGAMIEKTKNEVKFPDIRGEILEIVVQYFHYKVGAYFPFVETSCFAGNESKKQNIDVE